jgi:hypothetical protein
VVQLCVLVLRVRLRSDRGESRTPRDGDWSRGVRRDLDGGEPERSGVRPVKSEIAAWRYNSDVAVRRKVATALYPGLLLATEID